LALESGFADGGFAGGGGGVGFWAKSGTARLNTQQAAVARAADLGPGDGSERNIHALLNHVLSLGFVAGQTVPQEHKSKPMERLYAAGNFCVNPASSPVGGYHPSVLGFGVAQDVTVAVIGSYAEVSFAGRVPAILDGHDLQGSFAQVLPKWAFVGFKPGVGFYADEMVTHGAD